MVNTLSPPASVIESWPKPNYVDPEDQGPALFIVCILFSVIGVFLVSARVWSRLFLTRAPGSDDFLIVLGTAFTLALSAMIAVANKKYHNGRHLWDVPVTLYAPHRLNIWICEWLYLAAAACIKISILLFYRRLSVSFPAGFKIATWVGIVYNILVWLAFVIALMVLCKPMKAFWLSFDIFWAASHKHKCATEQVTLPLSGALSVLGDLYATVLPMAMVNLIPRSFKQKLGLYGLFGIGFLSVIAGIIRTYLMNRLINVDYDFFPPLYWTWMTTLIELWVAIFAACAPALKPFFKTFVVVPVTKAKTSGVRSTSANSPGPGTWNSSAPWSHTSMDENSVPVDLEKVGIAHGFPEKINPGTHTTWVELQNGNDLDHTYQLPTRRYSKMISFPEEREASIDEIALAR